MLTLTVLNLVLLIIISLTTYFGIKEIRSLRNENLEKEKERVALEKRVEIKDDEKNQAHKIIRQQREFVGKMKGEFQVLQRFLEGILSPVEFATMYIYPSGLSGEEAFTFFSQMLKQEKEGLWILFTLKKNIKTGEFAHQKEWYELSEEGKKFFSNPANGVKISFPTLGCTIAVTGKFSEVLSQ